MDGNRRFAKEKGLHSSLGHYMGSKTLIQTINSMNPPSPKYFSLFLKKFIKDNKIRIRVIGNLSYVNESYRKIIHDIEQKTKEFDNLNLNIFFSYTSRNEMSLCKFNPNLYFDTYKGLIEERKVGYNMPVTTNHGYLENYRTNEKVSNRKSHQTKCTCGQFSLLDKEKIKIVSYHKKLLTSHLPPPNILIRTSGEQRLSDFMLYQVGQTGKKLKLNLCPRDTQAQGHFRVYGNLFHK
ncbi:dehydrodolichyl diphosphate synthetase, putative [Plasmodium ovale curtisi]|uniref:Dehydrodolichyl diphosphate synthetase, putative n=1 Tax=Plasmodium ovale curtisi TaxID=864141 RepID=A0A1A8VNW0_PLAOA|nr:dehydrodolichyl diphosphate synthetase, putative [Plasmodium ovale curtisi]